MDGYSMRNATRFKPVLAVALLGFGSAAWPQAEDTASTGSLAAQQSTAQKDPALVGVLPVTPLAASENTATSGERAVPVQLDAVVITGEKLGRKLAETSTSTAVLRARDLEAQGDARVQDAVQHVANVVLQDSDREISIRGVPQNGIGGDGETISIIVDGVALPQRAANFGGPLGVFDVDQIEVLRGAQSTAQGRNSLAGAVVVTTRAPSEDWNGRARYERSSFDGATFAVAGGGALVPGWLSGRISHEERIFRNNIVNTTRAENDAGRADTTTTRFKLKLAPASFSAYSGLLSLSQGDAEFGDNLHDSTFCERCETANERYTEQYWGKVWSLQQKLDLAAFGASPLWSLESITGYTPGRDYRFADYDRTEKHKGSAIFEQRENTRSKELRLHYKGDTVKAIAGVYGATIEQYSYNETVEPIPVAAGAALLSGSQFGDVRTRTAAGFGEMDWTFVPRWTLTAGARYQQEQSDTHQATNLQYSASGGVIGVPVTVPIPGGATDLLNQAAPNSVPANYDVTGRKRFPVLLPKLALGWQFLPNHRLALSWQKGYRSGGTSVSFFGGTRSDYGPEYTQTLELALRSAFPSLRAGFNANVFYTRWKDQQVTIGDSTSFYTTTANAGRSHLYGGELELNAKPFRTLWDGWLRGLEPFASLGLLRTEFDSFVNGGTDYAGNRFPFAPNVSGTLGSRYQVGHFFAFAAATYNGAYYGNPSNTAETHVPAKTLLNARLGWQQGGVKWSLFGRNLGNDLNLQDRFVAGTTSDRRVAKRYGEPRLFGLAVEAVF